MSRYLPALPFSKLATQAAVLDFHFILQQKKNIVSTSYFTDNMDLVKTSSNILMHVSMKCDGPSSDLLWKWLEKISLAYARSGNYPSPTVCKKMSSAHQESTSNVIEP